MSKTGKKKNAFGGGNPNSVYVPMSEMEQEVIARLIEAKNLEVLIHGWNFITEPKLTVGDAQVMIPLTIRFDGLSAPTFVHYFDLELRTKTGLTLFKERQACLYENRPLSVENGTELSMIWHIGVKCMDPAVVKMILPGAIGLTSRVIDKDTGNATLLGNLHLNEGLKRTLAAVRKGEARARALKR